MPLTSCEKDKDGNTGLEESHHDAFSDDDEIEVIGYDALSWLQGNLVVVNDNDEIVRRICGEALDPSQPDVISIPVLGLEAAEKTFLSWVAPTKESTKVDGGYDYNLTDNEGKNQGSVSFRAVEGEAGVIARMSVAEGTALKQISEVNFVDYDFWPENADYPVYEAGKIYELEDYVFEWDWDWLVDTLKSVELKPLPFYCIQGNTDGNEGILVWLCPDDDNGYHHPQPMYYMWNGVYNYLPTQSVAQKVLDFYNKNNAFWKNMLKEMDEKGYQWSADDSWYSFVCKTTGNSEFIINNTNELSISFLDLDDDKGSIDNVSYISPNLFRYMHIHTIPAVN